MARGAAADPLRVIVAGAGIVGAAIAYRLASRGASVQLIDAIAPDRLVLATGAAAALRCRRNPHPLPPAMNCSLGPVRFRRTRE